MKVTMNVCIINDIEYNYEVRVDFEGGDCEVYYTGNLQTALNFIAKQVSEVEND